MATRRAGALVVLAGLASLVWAPAAQAQEGVSPWELLTKRGSFIVGIGLPQIILGILITITVAALIYNVIRGMEKPTGEQEWVKQPELDEEAEAQAAAAEAAAAQAAVAAAAAAAVAAVAAQAAPAPEPAAAAEPIFAPLKPAFTAPPPEITGEAKTEGAEADPGRAVPASQAQQVEPPVEPAVVAPTATTAGAPTEQYLAPTPQEPVEETSELVVPEPQAPEPQVPEPPPGQAWVDAEAPKEP